LFLLGKYSPGDLFSDFDEQLPMHFPCLVAGSMA